MLNLTKTEYNELLWAINLRRKELEKDLKNVEHLNIAGKFDSQLIALGNAQRKLTEEFINNPNNQSNYRKPLPRCEDCKKPDCNTNCIYNLS